MAYIVKGDSYTGYVSGENVNLDHVIQITVDADRLGGSPDKSLSETGGKLTFHMAKDQITPIVWKFDTTSNATTALTSLFEDEVANEHESISENAPT